MRKTSSLRRIDELGRVVLPKEIRQKLCLNQGAEVLVECEDDKVVITHHSKLSFYEKNAKIVVKCFDSFNVECFVCSTSDIIAKSCNVIINKKLFDYFFERKNVILSGNNLLGLTQDTKTEIILPIISNGEVCGGMVLTSKTLLTDYSFALPMQKYLSLMID